MTRRNLVAACSMLACWGLLCVVPITAQSRAGKRAAPGDPLTGTWSGELAPQNVERPANVTLDLKFDGKRAVSGTITGFPSPGDVKVGTFDPKTGALTLRLGKTGDSTVLIVLEGTVVKGTASGRLSGEAGDGEFKLTKKG